MQLENHNNPVHEMGVFCPILQLAQVEHINGNIRQEVSAVLYT